MATLTVYPVVGTTVDGAISSNNQSTWTAARDATTGTVANTSNTDLRLFLNRKDNNNNCEVQRSFFLFDTSSLGSGAIISSAVLSFYSTTGDDVYNASSTSLQIVSATPASNTSLTGDDFDNVGSTSFGSMNLSSWTAYGAYNDITLNSSGLAAINKTGITKFAVRGGLDLSNTEPETNKLNQIKVYRSNYSGTDRDPKLVITYTVAASMVAGTGAFTLTGNAATLFKGYIMSAAKGTFNLTGQAVGFIVNRLMSAAKGVFDLTGQAVNLAKGYAMSALKGVFTLTGFNTAKYTNWIEDTKPTSTYTNDTKTSSSYTNDSKTSSSYTNDSK